jgi:hypothetical protein
MIMTKIEIKLNFAAITGSVGVGKKQLNMLKIADGIIAITS